MREEVVLVTGANGEIGHSLILHLGKNTNIRIVSLDILPLDEELRPYCDRAIQGDILDTMLLGRLVAEFEIRTIYHLASILSTKAEFTPDTAHKVNVEGTFNLLRLAVEQSQWQGKPVKFIYPSSIAVYGLPNLLIKSQAGKIKEHNFLQPITMYGCNKLYCEHLGRYYSNHFRQLANETRSITIDFRSIRFPGLISAITVPAGGTSDYGPEMIHYAAKGIPYKCFVRPDVTLPFMAMPDAVKAILQLEAVPKEQLTQFVYNVTSFSITAQDIYEMVLKAFPNVIITFEPDINRQNIVDSWPADVDDGCARKDWGWQPDYDKYRSFEEYLIPAVKKFYSKHNS